MALVSHDVSHKVPTCSNTQSSFGGVTEPTERSCSHVCAFRYASELVVVETPVIFSPIIGVREGTMRVVSVFICSHCNKELVSYINNNNNNNYINDISKGLWWEGWFMTQGRVQ